MKDGLLKRVYLRDGIKYSEVYYVTETDDAFVYVTFSTTDENEKFDNPNDRVEIDIAVSKIRNIFEPHKQTT
jgi:transposase